MAVINMVHLLITDVLMEYGIQVVQVPMGQKMQIGHSLYGFQIVLFLLVLHMMYYFTNHYMHFHIPQETVQKIQLLTIEKMQENFLEEKSI
mgnify:CR=1 FL=1